MELLKNKTFIISIALWSILTIVRILNHIPWFDEAHAWTIAEELNLIQIFELMKVEGHTFIWYLLLMPFAKFHIGYPYTMQFLNWIFCLIALVILWMKAPFNNVIKILITFSFPFTYVYSVYARCYSIGIMLLFILTVLYKDKLKHPILYSVLLIFCANTSTMALIGATGFGLLFLYDLIKSKPTIKNYIKIFLILGVGTGLICLQLFGVESTAIMDYRGINLPHHDILKILCIVIFLFISCFVPLLFFFKKNLQFLLFFLFTASLMSVCFMFKYYGHYWNHAFYWIYFIITLWLIFLENNQIKLKQIISMQLGIICFLHIFIPFFMNDEYLKLTQKDVAIKMVKIILSDKAIDKKSIILGNDNFAGYMLLPYKKYKLINYCEDRSFNYNVVNYPANNNLCYEKKLSSKVFNEYYTYLDKNRLIDLYNRNVGNDKEVYSVVSISPMVFEKSEITYIKDDKTGVFYSIHRYKCFKNEKEESICLYKIKKSE